MADLPYQIYRITDFARFSVVRITGLEGITQPDTEKTFGELKKRIQVAIEWLEGVNESAFEGKDDKEITLKTPGQVKLSAGKCNSPYPLRNRADIILVEYLNYFALPQFWFHVSIAYGILRSKGVDLGKMHFLNAAGDVKVHVEKAASS
jgi:uncharacterized protein